MKGNKIIIGSRESRLAVIQSQMVQDFIKSHHPDLEVEPEHPYSRWHHNKTIMLPGSAIFLNGGALLWGSF